VGSQPVTVESAPAPAAARVAAFLIDLVLAGAVALSCSLIAWIWLLAASGGGARQPSDSEIYGALALFAACLPIWGAIMLLCWSRRGQSPGLAAMALRLVVRGNVPPAPLRALVRLIVFCAATGVGLLTIVLIIAAAAAVAQRTLPAVLALALLLPLALALADPLCWVLTPDGRALHDLIAGTRVVRATGTPVAPAQPAEPVGPIE